MSFRETVRALFSRQQPERPIVDMGGRVASVCVPLYRNLKAHLGFGDALDTETVTFLNTVGRFDERIMEYFQVPFRRIFLKPPSTFELRTDDDGSFYDEWGVKYTPRGYYNERTGHPLADASIKDLETFIHIGLWENFLGAVGEYVDMVETADDLGSQAGLMISPGMYRKYIKPRHTALNKAIRQQTQAKIFYHSCGAIMPIINDLVESGVQVLNPIQPLPGLMEAEELKQRYAGRLIFHGGLDVQTLLPEARPDDIRAHVCRYYETLGADSYIMAPTNTIQPGTPLKNILAAYEAALTYMA